MRPEILKNAPLRPLRYVHANVNGEIGRREGFVEISPVYEQVYPLALESIENSH